MNRKAPFLSAFAMLVLASLSCTNPIARYYSTRTAVMETATATMWTPTPTNTPTSTPTRTPTPTPTFTPTPDFILADDFSDSSSGWPTVNSSNVLKGYYQGGYHINTKVANIDAWSTPKPRKTYTDIRIEVDATKLAGPEENNFGFLCRYQDSDNFYGLVIVSAGYALIYKEEAGKFIPLSSEKFEPVDGINSGEELNQLAAVCNGDSLELYANDNLVASATDSSFTKGEIALLVGNFDTAGADILFDNLFIRNS
jgi:hypothetical protein